MTDVITDATLETKLQQSPRPRVTKDYIQTRIRDVRFTRLTTTLTTAIVVLDNGFVVTGEAACVNPENYDEEIGKKISFENAFNKLWPLFGFLLAEANGRLPVGEFARLEDTFPAWKQSSDVTASIFEGVRVAPVVEETPPQSLPEAASA